MTGYYFKITECPIRKGQYRIDGAAQEWPRRSIEIRDRPILIIDEELLKELPVLTSILLNNALRHIDELQSAVEKLENPDRSDW